MRNAYILGSDVLGCVLGDDTTPVNIFKLSPPKREPALALLEHLKGVEQSAIDKGKGGWFSKTLPGDQTRQNDLATISAAQVRVQSLPAGSQLSAADWKSVQDASMLATGDWSAVNDGRVYQDAVFNQLLQDMKDNAAALPSKVADAAGTEAGKILEGATGIPPWAWKVGIGVGVVAVGFASYKILLAAAPSAAGAFFGGRR